MLNLQYRGLTFNKHLLQGFIQWTIQPEAQDRREKKQNQTFRKDTSQRIQDSQIRFEKKERSYGKVEEKNYQRKMFGQTE